MPTPRHGGMGFGRGYRPARRHPPPGILQLASVWRMGPRPPTPTIAWLRHALPAHPLAHGASTPTRRDYVLANPEAFGLITNFSVDHEAGFDVHSVLKFSIKCDEDYKEVQAKKIVKSLVEAKQQMLKERFLKGNREKREQQKKTKEQKMKENAIINIKKLHVSHKNNTGQDKKGQTPSDWNNAIQCAKDEAKREKEMDLPDDGQFHPKPD